MREIKFRAWDKESKYMITSLQSIANIVKKFILGFPEKGLDGEGGDYPNGHVTGNDYLLMQYTGLKDKNGKEIYEGDIVEIDREKTDLAKLNPIREKVEYYKNAFLPVAHGDEKFEIIGNIYENPELLKD